jgi:hypothetical protein
VVVSSGGLVGGLSSGEGVLEALDFPDAKAMGLCTFRRVTIGLAIVSLLLKAASNNWNQSCWGTYFSLSTRKAGPHVRSGVGTLILRGRNPPRGSGGVGKACAVGGCPGTGSRRRSGPGWG